MNIVLAAWESMQAIHGLQASRTTTHYSGSDIEEENNAIESFMEYPDSICNADFQNDEIGIASELILGIRRKCSKCFAEKVLKFLCMLRLTSMDLKIIKSMSEISGKRISEDCVLAEHESNNAVEFDKFWERQSAFILPAKSFRNYQDSEVA